MTGNDTAPQDPGAGLRSLLRDHGQRWEIQLIGAHWEATSHPSPSSTIVRCADDLTALRAKLEAAESD